jgi:hypothetical protein
MTEIARFPAIIRVSETGKHPILIHRLINNASKCYKFQRKCVTRDGIAQYYSCYGCCEAKKRLEEYKQQTVSTIRVSLDNRNFKTDPELLDHFCEEFEYSNVEAVQIYR